MIAKAESQKRLKKADFEVQIKKKAGIDMQVKKKADFDMQLKTKAGIDRTIRLQYEMKAKAESQKQLKQKADIEMQVKEEADFDMQLKSRVNPVNPSGQGHIDVVSINFGVEECSDNVHMVHFPSKLRSRGQQHSECCKLRDRSIALTSLTGRGRSILYFLGDVLRNRVASIAKKKNNSRYGSQM
jgi:hypothetical protein